MFIDRYVYFNQKSPQKDGRNNLERTIVELALHELINSYRPLCEQFNMCSVNEKLLIYTGTEFFQ